MDSWHQMPSFTIRETLEMLFHAMFCVCCVKLTRGYENALLVFYGMVSSAMLLMDFLYALGWEAVLFTFLALEE